MCNNIDNSRIVFIPTTTFELSIWNQLDSDGCYSQDTNTIYMINGDHICGTISHEFLHMIMFCLFGEKANRGLDYMFEKIDYSGVELERS